jgi:DNA-binding CsgD family transcriptional regulator
MRELIAASRGPSILGVDSMSQGLVQLYTGRPGAAKAAGVAQVREATARGQGGPADIGRYIIARADLAAGQAEGAVNAAQPAVEANHAGTAEMALPEFVAAACRARDRELAKSGFDELARRTEAAGTHWAHGIRCRCAALFEDDERAEDLYQEAIEHLKQSRAVIYLARTYFMYGQWLRRGKRRRDARQPLRAAVDMYEHMGAPDLADQAAAELRATGEHAKPRIAPANFDLTPQEGRVARLAAEGATNKDIAGRLFISASTVEYHLSKVFRKLDVTSRTQLARRILAGGAQPA